MSDIAYTMATGIDGHILSSGAAFLTYAVGSWIHRQGEAIEGELDG